MSTSPSGSLYGEFTSAIAGNNMSANRVYKFLGTNINDKGVIGQVIGPNLRPQFGTFVVVQNDDDGTDGKRFTSTPLRTVMSLNYPVPVGNPPGPDSPINIWCEFTPILGNEIQDNLDGSQTMPQKPFGTPYMINVAQFLAHLLQVEANTALWDSQILTIFDVPTTVQMATKAIQTALAPLEAV